MKIVFNGGGYRQLSEHDISECQKLGKFLASIGAEVMTGGGGGFPYQVGKAAVLAGGKVIGRSPARNPKEHEEKYNFKFDGVTDMIYVKKKFKKHAEGLLQRMQDMQTFGEITITMGGTWGTLYELILSFYHKKTIILIDEFEGATTLFKDIHKYFGTRGDINPAIHFGSKIIAVKNVDEAIEALKKIQAESKGE